MRVRFNWPAITYCGYQFDAILLYFICLQAFEASCFEGREVPEKRKKDQFRKLVSGIVGVRIIRNYFYILFLLLFSNGR